MTQIHITRCTIKKTLKYIQKKAVDHLVKTNVVFNEFLVLSSSEGVGTPTESNSQFKNNGVRRVLQDGQNLAILLWTDGFVG